MSLDRTMSENAALAQNERLFVRVLIRAGQNGIDIEVSRHHTVSVSNFQSIKVSTDNWMVYL